MYVLLHILAMVVLALGLIGAAVGGFLLGRGEGKSEAKRISIALFVTSGVIFIAVAVLGFLLMGVDA